MVDKKQSGKPSKRIRIKRAQARRDILESARRLLDEEGLDAVTLASVSGELGMSKQALYHYFSSKDALVRSLVTALLDEEVEALIAAVESRGKRRSVLGTLITEFYSHYIHRLDAFRLVYCQSQLYTGLNLGKDPALIREEVNPRTRHLFDVLEECLVESGASRTERKRARQLAFTAWTSALGLLTMLSVADATNDPLVHTDQELLKTLVGLYE